MNNSQQMNIDIASGEQIGEGKNSLCFKVADLDNPNKFYAVLMPKPEIYRQSLDNWESSMRNAKKRSDYIRGKIKSKNIIIPKIHKITSIKSTSSEGEDGITFPFAIMDLVENTTIIREDTLTELPDMIQNKIVNSLAIFITTIHSSHLWNEEDEPKYIREGKSRRNALLRLLKVDKITKVLHKALIAKKQNKPINGFVDYNSENIRFDKNHNLVIMDFASASTTTPTKELTTLARMNSPTLLEKIPAYYNKHSKKIKIKDELALKACTLLEITIDQMEKFLKTRDGSLLKGTLDKIRTICYYASSLGAKKESEEFRAAMHSFLGTESAGNSLRTGSNRQKLTTICCD